MPKGNKCKVNEKLAIKISFSLIIGIIPLALILVALNVKADYSLMAIGIMFFSGILVRVWGDATL